MNLLSSGDPDAIVRWNLDTFSARLVPEPRGLLLLAALALVAVAAGARRSARARGAVRAAGAALVLATFAASPRAALAQDFGASVGGTPSGIDFAGASPTLNTGLPDIFNNVSFFGVGGDGSASASGSFREIYVGTDPGNGQSVEWEVDLSGSASLASGRLRADALAVDQRNAGANLWQANVISRYHDVVEFSGPTNPNGFYEVLVRTTLDPFTAQDENPGGLGFLWEANVSTRLEVDIDPTAPGSTILRTTARLNEDCPSFSAPPPACNPFFFNPVFEDSRTILVPGSDPFLHIEHSLLVQVRSASADVSNTAGLEIEVAPGVVFESDSTVLLTAADDTDSDGDGVPDVGDNCVDVPNPGQEDVNAAEDDDSTLAGVQHYGDACDADLDEDGAVAASDFFGVFRPCLGALVAVTPACAEADFDANGMVGASDFFSGLRPSLGSTPGPGVTE